MTKILAKLHSIMDELPYIEKDKRNEFHGYTYLSEQAIKEAIHPLLVKHGVIFTVSIDGPVNRTDYTSDKGRRSALTDIVLRYKFWDVDSGEYLEGWMPGTGDDSNDKGTYKAITGAIKYILTSTLLIPTGDDPEQDAVDYSTKPASRLPARRPAATQSPKTATGSPVKPQTTTTTGPTTPAAPAAEAVKEPADPRKAKITELMLKIDPGLKGKSKAVWDAAIWGRTKLQAKPENFDEITNRLAVLVSEQADQKGN